MSDKQESSSVGAPGAEEATALEEQLRQAATNGDSAEVERLAAFVLDAPNENGWTALGLASLHGHARCVELLIPLGDPNVELRIKHAGGRASAYTPFHIALIKNHADCVAALAPHCDCRSVDEMGDTPLMKAARSDFLDVVSVLIPFCDVDAVNEEWGDSENTALKICVEKAIAFADPNASKNLANMGPDLATRGPLIEMLAGATLGPLSEQTQERLALARRIVKPKRSFDEFSAVEKLHYCAARGKAEGVARWLKETADEPDEFGEMALGKAAAAQSIACLDLLIPGASAAAVEVALMRAVDGKDIECLKRLVDAARGATPPATGYTPLMQAVFLSRADFVECLLPVSNANAIDTADSQKTYTALWIAVEEGALDCVRLLASRSDQDWKNSQNKSIVEHAESALRLESGQPPPPDRMRILDMLAARRPVEEIANLAQRVGLPAEMERCRAILEASDLREELGLGDGKDKGPELDKKQDAPRRPARAL